MEEYISRKSVMEAYEEEQRRNGPWRFETLINSVPAADVSPIVHAKWIDEDFPEKLATVHGFAVCSACGELSHKAEHGYNILSKYCPHCGAKMDLE